MGRSRKGGEAMNGRWYNPLDETPEGQLLKEVQQLLKEVQNKDKADLDKDGKLSGYEKKRAKAIESSMAEQGYKSDRGQKPAPKLPKAKKNKTVIKFDMSDNCWCGANPHEECRGGGEMRAIDCKKNPIAFDSRFDDARSHSLLEHVDEGHGPVLIARSDDKNTECGMCKNVECMGGCGMTKASMDEKNKYCKKHFGCSYAECNAKQKAQCDKECGSSEVKKYYQEPSVDNLYPHFNNVDGGVPVRAQGYGTNGTYPATNDGPSKSIISETAKMPAYAKSGYTAKSSSLHMNLNTVGGERKGGPNTDSIEARLASLTKHAGHNNMGIIGEIEGLLKQVKSLIDTPSN